MRCAKLSLFSYPLLMKICVGLSGGVDSSVAALLLKQQGYDVFAMFMQNWHDADSTLHGECEWEEDRFIAEMVARKIGIPFYFVDLSKEYRKRVVDYMFDEYAKGRTPNPDVLCNREIKFDAFLKAAASLGADMVATGHYCRRAETVAPDGSVSYSLLAGVDPGKDQSYFLCQLSQEQLSRAMFPIGHLLKSEVRELARRADLPSAEKKDSQGICFVGKVDLPVFLQQKLKPCEGQVIEVYDAYYAQNEQYQSICGILRSVLGEGRELNMITDYISEDKFTPAIHGGLPYDLEKVASLDDADLDRISAPLRYDLHFETETYRSGRHHTKKTRYKANPYGVIAGTHDGAQFYTVGQRKGLNIGGHKDSLFVLATDVEKNIIYVGEGHRHRGLSRSCLSIEASDLHWINAGRRLMPGQMMRCRVRIRYRQPLQDATLIMRSSRMYILFDQPQRGVTPGQFAAWYDGDELLGSGVF